MRSRKTTGAGLALAIMLCAAYAAYAQFIPWPVEPTNQVHSLGNSFGEYQRYDSQVYFHPGIDIRDSAGASGPWVVSCAAGIPDISYNPIDPIYDQIKITLDSLEQIYAHLDRTTIPQNVRDAYLADSSMSPGTRLGNIVAWPVADFHHLHFEWIIDDAYRNPLNYLTPAVDINAPTVDSLWICENNTSNFMLKPAAGPWIISGPVDIVAKSCDTFDPGPSGTQSIGVYEIRYEIDELAGNHDIHETTLWEFSVLPDSMDRFAHIHTIFKEVPPCLSNSEYWATEAYYYIVTNTSSGQLSEPNGLWDTRLFPNGQYEISIKAIDEAGGVTVLKDTVTVQNPSEVPALTHFGMAVLVALIAAAAFGLIRRS